MPGHRKRRQFKQTDAFTKGMVIGLKRAGWSIRQIAADSHLGASTVHRLWRRWLEQGNVAIYRNAGATRVTSARVDRRILRQAVAAPQATCTAILQHVQDTLDHSISTRTISRRLVANGLHSCRPLRRLPLTPPNRRQRLEWCRARSTWMTEWHRVVFSDESRFCLSSDSRRVRVWRRRGERSNPAAIVERPTVRQRGIMVWGAIAYDSRSPLLRIQGTMTAQRYVDDVLRPVTLPYLQGVPNAFYQQDNARPHTARISQQALQDVQMLPWPPYSPDLSPIEHVWDIIGRRLHALPQPRSEDELWQMVEREWRAIPQDAIRTLIDSLPRRVAACIAVRGRAERCDSSPVRFHLRGVRAGGDPGCSNLQQAGDLLPHTTTDLIQLNLHTNSDVIEGGHRQSASACLSHSLSLHVSEIASKFVSWPLPLSCGLSPITLGANIQPCLCFFCPRVERISTLASRTRLPVYPYVERIITFATILQKVDRITEDIDMQRMTEAPVVSGAIVWMLLLLALHLDDPVDHLKDAMRGLAVPRIEQRIPGHRKRRQFKQTDAFTRGMVIGLKRAGWSIRQIAADTHLGASTVHRLWRRWLEQGNVAIYRNVGATRVTSARVDRRILRQAVAAPQATCTAILQHVQDTLDHSISTRTISRRLVANGLHSCRPLRRLPLTPPNRRQRLEWCRARSTWMTEWHRVVFSDESRFCLSSDSRRVRVWRRRGERSNPAAIVERPTVRQRGIMVWGAIAYDSRSPLLRIQGTMTAQRYVDDVLRPVTLPYLQGVPNALYQQDNARPHTARISQQALQDVQMLPWPPYSPDLSPIEHVWDIIGRRLHALPQPRSEDELWQMVEREWRAIPEDAIRTLIDSLLRRVAACIAVRAASLRTLTLCLDQLLNRESEEAITYDGDEPAAHFFSQLESQPNFHNLEPARQARKALSSLRGEPRKIAQDLALFNKTYEEVKESLCAVYPRRPSFTLQEFYELKCTSMAEIETYYKNKVRIGLAINLPKSAIVQALSNGLPRNYGNLLKMAQSSGPEEWLCLAQQLTYEGDNTSTKAAQQRSPRQSRAPSTTVDKTPPYPCRYCGGQHWHAQCQQRGPYQRTFRTFTPAVHSVEQPQRSTGPAGVYETAATTSSGET
ncbi:hypothetical protein LAZ67_11000440, partial [Cordylochernes scorpioides]